MSEPFFTVGHSNRTIADFIELLRGSGVRLVVDVRRQPGSARYPQFDRDPLEAELGGVGIAYRRPEELTGRRPVNPDVPFAVNGWWENRSFHNYADHALSDDFRQALAELRDWGRPRRVAVMCAEAVWWRCHRRIIADHLLAHGEDVRHIIGAEPAEAARLSEGAAVGADHVVTYPAAG